MEVLFLTCPLSLLSIIGRDNRLQDGLLQKRNRLIREQDGIWSFVWFTLWHPANLRFDILNKISSFLFKYYSSFSLGESESFIKTADMFIFESSAALMLYPRLKKLNPTARFVYRVSDDLRLLKCHPVIIKAEEDFAKEFDLVSVPNVEMLKLFNDDKTNLELSLHGINKRIFDIEYPNPYEDIDRPNLVFVGISHVDIDFFERASRIFPEWMFHVIGPINGLPDRPNVKAYGEMNFADTLPFIKHADIGLATRSYEPGAESLGDSLKVIQYSYCRLPIVAPHFLNSSRSNMFFYSAGDDTSISSALLNALSFNRAGFNRDDILSWEELAEKLVGNEQIGVKRCVNN
jgi:2-beta-glucuronyltransferase